MPEPQAPHSQSADWQASPSDPQREPFTLAPDPGVFFPSSGQSGAYERIVAGLEAGSNLAAVFGGPGTGKTLLMRRMERELEAKGWAVQSAYRAVFSFQEFLQNCCKNLGADPPPQGLNAQLNAIHKRLSALQAPMVILLDEAESTRDQVLDAITRLSQLDANGGPQIRVVVFGQQALSRKLQALASRPSFELKASLRPYTDDEVGEYMLWHLRECSMDPRKTFSASAVAEICASSGGTPGRINLLAASALLEAQLAGTLPVSASLVNAIAGDLGIYAVSATHDESSWFRDSSLDEGSDRSTPESSDDLDLFDPSTPGEANDATNWGELADVLPEEPSIPLLERAAPLIDNPFEDSFDEGQKAEPMPRGERRAANQPVAAPAPSPPSLSAETPRVIKAPPAPPDRLDLDLSRALNEADSAVADNRSSEFSLDSIARDDRTDPVSEPDLPTITLDHAPAPRAHLPEPPAATVPKARDARLDPTVLAATAASAQRRGEPRLGDGSYTDLTHPGDTYQDAPRKLAVVRSRPARPGRKLLRTGLLVVVLTPLAALVARAIGVPPAVSQTWNELAPEALRPLPEKVDTWLEGALAKLPWPSAARDEAPPSVPASANDEATSPAATAPPADDGPLTAQQPDSSAGLTSTSATATPAAPDAESPSGTTGSVGANTALPASSAPAVQAPNTAPADAQGVRPSPDPSSPSPQPASGEESAEPPAPQTTTGVPPDAVSGQPTDPSRPVEVGAGATSEASATVDQSSADAGSEGTQEIGTGQGLPEDEQPAAPLTAAPTDEEPTPAAPGDASPVQAASDASEAAIPDVSSTAPIRPAEPVVRPDPPLLASGVSGFEDEPIPLMVKIGRQLDGKALTLELHGVPRGATITGARLSGAVWRAPGSQQTALALVPPKDSDKDFALSWRLIDDASGELLDTARSTVVVEARADAPTVRAKASAGDQYTPIPLELSAASNDSDGSERLSIVIRGLPSTAPLTPGRKQEDGTWLLEANQLEGVIITPGEGSPGTIELTVTAIATERDNGDNASSEAKVSFRVVPGTQ